MNVIGNNEDCRRLFRRGTVKPIRDEIDPVLAAHYGFTDEELDFIPSAQLRAGIPSTKLRAGNYDIKYRKGRPTTGNKSDLTYGSTPPTKTRLHARPPDWSRAREGRGAWWAGNTTMKIEIDTLDFHGILSA